MSIEEEILESIPSDLFTEFVQEYAPERVILCYEGIDDGRFYGRFVREVYKGISSKKIDCKGRENVLALYDEIPFGENYEQVRVLFFTDKDYYPAEIKGTNHFQTQYYSIESYLVEEEAIDHILPEALESYRAAQTASRIDSLVEAYKEAKDFFVQSIASELYGWARYHLEKRREHIEQANEDENSGHSFKLDLIAIHMRADIDFDAQSYLTDRQNSDNRKQRIRAGHNKDSGRNINTCNASVEELNFYIIEVQEDPLRWIKGKAFLILYQKFINSLGRGNPFNKDTTAPNLFNCISPNVYFPTELQTFLNHNYTQLQHNTSTL